jgi:hypothetical protein
VCLDLRLVRKHEYNCNGLFKAADHIPYMGDRHGVSRLQSSGTSEIHVCVRKLSLLLPLQSICFM